MNISFRIPPPPRLPPVANYTLAVVAPLLAMTIEHGLRAWSENITAILREVVDSFGAEASNAGTTLALEAPEPVVGHWDRMRLEQIVTNLLSNALKYGRDGFKPA